jgi:RNA polymerase sigma factor (sigma-70 family)
MKMGQSTDQSSASDNELVQQAVTGNHDALESLLNRCSPPVERKLSSEIGLQWRSVLDVEDVMQVTFLEVFLNIKSLEVHDIDTFRAWLWKIARNNLRDAIRGLQADKRPQPQDRKHAPSDISPIQTLALIHDTGTSVTGKAARGEANSRIESALKKLPDDYATVIRLFDLEGLNGPQVADQIDRTRGAVHMLRARAIDRLKQILGRESMFFSNT